MCWHRGKWVPRAPPQALPNTPPPAPVWQAVTLEISFILPIVNLILLSLVSIFNFSLVSAKIEQSWNAVFLGRITDEKLSNLNKENLEKIISNLIKNNKTNFKGVGQPLRIALVGSKFGPGIYNIILSLDKKEVIQRLKTVI